jgi:hypothetical protein
VGGVGRIVDEVDFAQQPLLVVLELPHHVVHSHALVMVRIDVLMQT